MMARISATPAERITLRRRAIFAAARAAGMDSDETRAFVRSKVGVGLSDCTLGQLGDVLDALNHGKQGYAGRKRSSPSAERKPLLDKIDALLAELHRVTGKVHTLKYADAIAKRNGWAECIDFADVRALKNVVGALNRTLQYRIGGD